jgi:hypothetical protein
MPNGSSIAVCQFSAKITGIFAASPPRMFLGIISLDRLTRF